MDDEAREAFGNTVLDTIGRYAPGLRSLVTASELLTPADLETEFGMTGGHWHHAELTLVQFLWLSLEFLL